MYKIDIELKNRLRTLIVVLSFSPIMSAQCLSGDCANGTGIWKDASGTIYKGEFRDGTITGKGTLTYPENIDEGPFEESLVKDILIYKGAMTYTGELSLGEPNGKGLLEFYSGQKIECIWEGGDPVGKTTWTVPNSVLGSNDGYVITGLINDWQISGDGQIEYNTGDIYRGNLLNFQ